MRKGPGARNQGGLGHRAGASTKRQEPSASRVPVREFLGGEWMTYYPTEFERRRHVAREEARS